jgi:hypothetical protein
VNVTRPIWAALTPAEQSQDGRGLFVITLKNR